MLISHVGMIQKKVNIVNEGQVVIIMSSAPNNMEEVVVIGYGTQKLKNVTGSVVAVDLKKLTDMPVASITEALRGQVPGLSVTGGSNRPGNHASLIIQCKIWIFTTRIIC